MKQVINNGSQTEATAFHRKEFITIDGHKHGMIIEGGNPENPVLLFLHGGPGYPQYPMIKASGLEWADDVTVCYWEQRGAGMSFDAKTQGKLSLEVYIQDILAVTKFLKNEFNKEKILLFGHSWGTLIGSIAASKYPEHYHAYIGAGQLGRHKESNEETYQFLLKTAIEKGDKKAEQTIRKVQFDEDFYKSEPYRKILNRYLIKYGGGMKRYNYTQRQGLLEIFRCKTYTWKEKFNIPRGTFLTYDAMAETMAKADVAALAPRFQVPVYIIQGKFDYQTSYNEARRFFDKIEAPHKKMFTFEECAHTPFIEEKEYFLQDVFRKGILPNI